RTALRRPAPGPKYSPATNRSMPTSRFSSACEPPVQRGHDSGRYRRVPARRGPGMVSAPNRLRATALTANSHHRRPVIGVLLKLSSVVLLAGLSAVVKYLGDGIPTGQLIFVRGVISLAVLAFIAWRIYGLQI